MVTEKLHPPRYDSTRQAGKGVKTRELILETSRKCLNERGVSAVNCRYVAKAAGLTPGNIYYYFDNMDAIHAELGLALGADIETNLQTLADGGISSPEGRRRATMDWLGIVWTWRYFFLDFDQIIRGDERVRANVRESQKRSVDLHAKNLENLLTSKGAVLTENDRQLCHDLAVSNWIMAINWIQHVSLNQDISAMTRDDFVGTVGRYMTVSRTLFDDDFLNRLTLSAPNTTTSFKHH